MLSEHHLLKDYISCLKLLIIIFRMYINNFPIHNGSNILILGNEIDIQSSKFSMKS